MPRGTDEGDFGGGRGGEVTNTIEFVATILAGTALLISAVGRSGPIAWMAGILGTLVILHSLITPTVVTWRARKATPPNYAD